MTDQSMLMYANAALAAAFRALYRERRESSADAETEEESAEQCGVELAQALVDITAQSKETHEVIARMEGVSETLFGGSSG